MVKAALAALAPEVPADPGTLKHLYQIMHLGRVLDDKAPNYLKQAV